MGLLLVLNSEQTQYTHRISITVRVGDVICRKSSTENAQFTLWERRLWTYCTVYGEYHRVDANPNLGSRTGRPSESNNWRIYSPPLHPSSSWLQCLREFYQIPMVTTVLRCLIAGRITPWQEQYGYFHRRQTVSTTTTWHLTFKPQPAS